MVTKLGVSLLKKSVHDLLLLTHKFLAFLETVRLAFNVDDGAVMQDTVQDSGGDGDVGKDLVPLGEGLIGREDGGGLLIASGNQLEKQICALNVHREITDFVDNEHPVLGQHLELVQQAVLKKSFFEQLNELVTVDVVSGEPMLRRHKAQGGGQMGFAHAGRAEEDHVFSVFQKAHSGQLIDLALINRGLEGEIEVVQGFLNREAGHTGHGAAALGQGTGGR